MKARQRSWPRVWLMTDERMGDRLWSAIDRLPAGAGVIFRHYSLDRPEREALGQQIADRALANGLTLGVAADVDLARRVGAALVHNPTSACGQLPFSRAVHSLEDAERARRDGAALVFVSPVHSTRSHPGIEPLRRSLANRIARTAGVPAIALGGMDQQRFSELDKGVFHGWAAIDAWLSIRT